MLTLPEQFPSSYYFPLRDPIQSTGVITYLVELNSFLNEKDDASDDLLIKPLGSGPLTDDQLSHLFMEYPVHPGVGNVRYDGTLLDEQNCIQFNNTAPDDPFHDGLWRTDKFRSSFPMDPGSRVRTFDLRLRVHPSYTLTEPEIKTIQVEIFTISNPLYPFGTEPPKLKYLIPIVIAPPFFEEVGPESGLDNFKRLREEDQLERPWLTVPGTGQVDLVTLLDQQLNLQVEVPDGFQGEVTPDQSDGERTRLTITGDEEFPGDQFSYEGTLDFVLQEGDEELRTPVLNLAFYRRRELTVAVHLITALNDDLDKAGRGTSLCPLYRSRTRRDPKQLRWRTG